MYTIITLKDISDLISTKKFVIIRVNLEDNAFDILIFPNTWSWFGMKVLIISAAVHIQNLTEKFDIMLKTQLMNGV